MSGLPTAPDTDIGFQPPPHVPFAAPISGDDGLGPVEPMPIVGGKPILYNPIILMLIGYFKDHHNSSMKNALDEAVASAYKKIPDFMDKLRIRDGRSFLTFANDLLKWIPHEDFYGKKVYDILTMFYFVFDQPPLAKLQTPIEPNQVGQPLTWLSSWIVVFAQLVGLHMDDPTSLTAGSLKTFKDSPKYRFKEAKIPPGGFRTFNQFFARHLKEGMRPITEPDNDRIIVYPADCTFDGESLDPNMFSVERDGLVYIKNVPWSIKSLLQGCEFAQEFDGGVWMHAFLNTFNYHRQHAPVSGKVLEAKNIQGAAYLEVNEKCELKRHICGPDAPDTPGYQFLQSRGCFILENEYLGKVAVLPIGMAQVSSVKLTVKEGDWVQKGDEISCFQFGGSDIICVFQAKAGLKRDSFTFSPGPKKNPEVPYSEMGTILAKAP
ncbi:phosphatidylserine decarboxylase 2 [Fusarium albosuccineum]|uniref:Phosphatidylserine decarboxylase 2 n=1 Tax=Fusarium albosuccineum TaxID=1237068 RepID=A0A8H4LEU7_9HYPO|nr:phosphatidylserine decarboxylase 2 [Fusarium albosuccineum]